MPFKTIAMQVGVCVRRDISTGVPNWHRRARLIALPYLKHRAEGRAPAGAADGQRGRDPTATSFPGQSAVCWRNSKPVTGTVLRIETGAASESRPGYPVVSATQLYLWPADRFHDDSSLQIGGEVGYGF